MSKSIKSIFNITALMFLTLNLSNCASFTKDYKQTAEFDTHPQNYWQAKATSDVKLPKYIAKNISQKPIYPINLSENVKGDLKISKVPPTLRGKIEEFE